MEKEKEKEELQSNIQQLNMLSNKEIYRILSFEYRQPDGLKIDTIASLVSKVFYPFEEPEVLRKNFNSDITRAFEPYADQHGKINEEKFCEVMNKIDRYINKDNYSRFVLKIFKRHDSDKDDLLNKENFTTLMRNFQDPNLTDKDINDIYGSMLKDSKSPDGIDFNAFLKKSL